MTVLSAFAEVLEYVEIPRIERLELPSGWVEIEGVEVTTDDSGLTTFKATKRNGSVVSGDWLPMVESCVNYRRYAGRVIDALASKGIRLTDARD